MRFSHRLGARVLTVALVALASASCGSSKGAVTNGSPNGGDDTNADAAATSTTASDGGAGDAGPQDSGPAIMAGAGNDRCTSAAMIPLDAETPRVDLSATTTGAAHDVDAPCSADQGPDVFYQFAFSKRVFVYADTFGASFPTTLFLLSDACAPIANAMSGGATCNTQSCGTGQSQIVALLEPGSYRLGLAGRGGATGDATIHFQWALAGSGAVAELPSTDSVQTGTTKSGAGNIDGISSECIAAGAENSYWWTRCPSDPERTLTASTCNGGTSWESVLETQIPGSAPGLPSAYKCDVDGCGDLQSTLTAKIPAGAGLGVLSIDGQGGGDFGAYSMTVTYAP